MTSCTIFVCVSQIKKNYRPESFKIAFATTTRDLNHKSISYSYKRHNPTADLNYITPNHTKDIHCKK